MLRIVFYIAAFAVLVAARDAPNAAYVRERFSSQEGVLYSNDVLEDAQLDVPDLIEKYDYPVEVHTVTTSDGYILEMHRIPHGRADTDLSGVRKPVLIMHGLLSSSADFVTIGTEFALAYHLADSGFDVWLGNARGNYYSRRHTRLNPDSILNKDFWRFSWDEIGNHDLPAFVDHILSFTKQPKLHYIGHSQGGTSFLVLNSLRPEYNEKFYSFHGLAPASFFTHNEGSMYNSLASYESFLENTAFLLGFAEIFGNREFTEWFRDEFCVENSMFSGLCESVITGLTEREYYNSTLLPVIFGHTPAGSSIRQVAHYGQVIRYDAFRRYNFNSATNLITYGRLSPPAYDLSRVTVPTYLYYGLNDREVNFRDVLKLADHLPNVKTLFEIERATFNHFDFLWSMDCKELFYSDLVASLRASN